MFHVDLLTQIEFIRFIQQIRSPFIDLFFLFMNFFDTQYFMFIVLSVLLIGWNWKWGIRFIYVTFLGSVLIGFLKETFDVPRPFLVDPSIGIMFVSGRSFPSGAAQTSVLLPGLLIYLFRKRWIWVCGIIFGLLLSFSRIYLGVHYPIDILGGWLCGAMLLTLFILCHASIEKFLQRLSRTNLLLLAIIFPLLMLSVCFSSYMLRYVLMVIFFGVGSLISYKQDLFLPEPKTAKAFFLRSMFGVTSFFLLFFSVFVFSQGILSFWDYLLQGAVIGLWSSCGVFFVLKKYLLRIL